MHSSCASVETTLYISLIDSTGLVNTWKLKWEWCLKVLKRLGFFFGLQISKYFHIKLCETKSSSYCQNLELSHFYVKQVAQMFWRRFSPLKKIVLFASMKALKNDEKCFLFHLKVACRVKANMIWTTKNITSFHYFSKKSVPQYSSGPWKVNEIVPWKY